MYVFWSDKSPWEDPEYRSDLVQWTQKKFSISFFSLLEIFQCSREMWSDFSAISGNLLEFAQLQMKKEKEEAFAKKKEKAVAKH